MREVSTAASTGGAGGRDPLLEIKGLKTHFFTDEGVVKAVDGADFAIARGKTVCVVGESGCGKSITARSILQIVDRPGRIVAGGILLHREGGEVVDVAALPPTGKAIRAVRGEAIAMIFQEPMSSLSPVRTIGNQIVEMMRLHLPVTREQARQRAAELLERVGIPQAGRHLDSYVFQLSGGMRQRAMIAMALSCRPNLLIADEAVSALDVSVQAQILNLLQELQAEFDLTYLFVAYELSVVDYISDRVAVMYVGKLVEVGSRARVFATPKHPYTEALLSALPKPDPRLRSAGARIRLSATWPTRPTRPPAATSIPAAATSRTAAPWRHRRCATWATAIASPATSPRSCSWPASATCRPAINDNLSSDRESL